MIHQANKMRVIIAAVFTAMSILSSAALSGCDGNAADGAILFQRERCIYCHTFKGHGATIGPDLTDVEKRRSDAWLRDQIRDPRLHDVDPRMPGHPYLTKKEINSLIKYLKS